MMRISKIAVAILVVGSVGVSAPAPAQSDPAYSPPPGSSALVPTPDDNAPGGMSTTVVTTPASSAIIQPGNTNPAHDDSGNRVTSSAAVVPDGFNGVSGTSAMGGPEEDTANVQTVPTTAAGVPACSRTITDNCVEKYNQTYKGPYTTH
jgi:hypothetical protein